MNPGASIRALACLVLVGPWLACIESDQLVLGDALQGIYLGTDTDIADFVRLRTGTFIAAYAEAETGHALGDLPIEGGGLEGWTSLRTAPLDEFGSGLYVTGPEELLTLSTISGDEVGIDADADANDGGGRRFVRGRIPPILKLDLEFPAHPVGTRLSVPLPAGYRRHYSHVIATLWDHEGNIRWTDRPETARDWFAFAGRPRRPKVITIPRSALDTMGAYGLAITFLVELDTEVASTLSFDLSGLLAGTAWLIPIGVVDEDALPDPTR